VNTAAQMMDLTVDVLATINELVVTTTTTTLDLIVNATTTTLDLVVNGTATIQNLVVTGVITLLTVLDLVVTGTATVQDLVVNGSIGSSVAGTDFTLPVTAGEEGFVLGITSFGTQTSEWVSSISNGTSGFVNGFYAEPTYTLVNGNNPALGPPGGGVVIGVEDPAVPGLKFWRMPDDIPFVGDTIRIIASPANAGESPTNPYRTTWAP